MSRWDDVLLDVQKKQQELLQAANKIYIVNAGRMNHGKSSLLNSLLAREVFKVADIRQTRENQQEEYYDNIYLVDTPGLDADKADNAEAYQIYKKANFILFVHNPRVGELHRSELEHIARIAKEVGEDYFWQHFALVLTFLEEFEPENLMSIRQKIEKSLQQQFKRKQILIFTISNTRFARSQQEQNAKKKQVFLQQSGVPALQKYLQDHFLQWQQENLFLQSQRFENYKAEAVRYLQGQQEKVQRHTAKEKNRSAKKLQHLQQSVGQAIRNYSAANSRLENVKQEVKQLKRRVKELEEQHEREYY